MEGTPLSAPESDQGMIPCRVSPKFLQTPSGEWRSLVFVVKGIRTLRGKENGTAPCTAGQEPPAGFQHKRRSSPFPATDGDGKDPVFHSAGIPAGRDYLTAFFIFSLTRSTLARASSLPRAAACLYHFLASSRFLATPFPPSYMEPRLFMALSSSCSAPFM